MNKRVITIVGLCSAGVAAAIAVASGRPADAQPMPAPQLVRDFYGEADEEVRAVPAAIPGGMACGSLTVDAGLTVQTSEPPGGFTGACLEDRTYGSQLPVVCFSPDGVSYGFADGGAPQSTICKAPAAQVAQPNWHVGVDPQAGKVAREDIDQSYRVLETCAPRLAQPDPTCQKWFNPAAGGLNYCPCNTVPVSRSCCTQYGTPMVSTDGQTASGKAYFGTAE